MPACVNYIREKKCAAIAIWQAMRILAKIQTTDNFTDKLCIPFDVTIYDNVLIEYNNIDNYKS